MRECRSTLFALRVLAVLALTALASGFSWMCHARGLIDPPNDHHLSQRLSGVRIPFIANLGQTDSMVAYYAATFAGTVFVTRRGEIVYALPERRSPKPTGASSNGDANALNDGWTLTETAIGGTPP